LWASEVIFGLKSNIINHLTRLIFIIITLIERGLVKVMLIYFTSDITVEYCY
jgi:hypothetical protein